MPSIEVNGSSLEYAEHGSGEPVVLVHGSASDLRTWHCQHDAFAERYRTIAYSRRYHWPNARISEGSEYPMVEQVDDLEAVLRSLDAAPAHLVGHSYGAFVCLLLASRAPDLVRSLVLAEPPVMSLLVSIPPKALEILGLAPRSPRTRRLGCPAPRTGASPPSAHRTARSTSDAAARRGSAGPPGTCRGRRRNGARSSCPGSGDRTSRGSRGRRCSRAGPRRTGTRRRAAARRTRSPRRTRPDSTTPT